MLDFRANVTAFDFDLSTGNLTLYFNDRMNLSTFDVEKISLLNMPYQAHVNLSHNASAYANSSAYGYVYYPLTGTHRWRQNNKNQDNATVVSVFLTADDYAKIVMDDYPIFTNASNAFLSVDEGLMESLRNESTLGTPVTAPLPVQTFLPDTLPPFLLSYELNMHVGYMTLLFSEPIDVSTFTIVGMAIQQSRNVRTAAEHANQYFAFVDADWNISSVSDYNRHVRVTLGSVNMNEIKSRVGLAVTRESSWLSAYQPFVNDTHGNAVSMKAFDMYNAVNAQRYWADTMRPGVQSWDIDMNTATVVITFTETIYRGFFNFSGVALTNNDASQPIYLRVENPVNFTVLNHPFLRFELSAEQILQLQSYDQFCTTTADCFLILDDGLVIDTSLAQNPYYSYGLATRSNPLAAQSLVPDTVRPKLVAFDMDIQVASNRVVLTLSFSKVMNVSSFRPEYLTLQSDSNLGAQTEFIALGQHLDAVVVNTTADGTEIVLTLFNPITRLLQIGGYLGKATYHTFLACTFALIHDRVVVPRPNKVVDIPQSAAIKVRRLVTDRTPPVLEAWSIDLDRGVMGFNFSRPIDIATVQTSEATLYSREMLTPLSTWSLTLTEATVSSGLVARTGPRTSFLQLMLSADELAYLSGFTDFCTASDNCYLSFSRAFVGALEDYDSVQGDKSYVAVQPVSFVASVGLVTPSRPVSIYNVTVDMSSLDVYIDFSVPVRTSLINVTALGLWVNDSSRVVSYYLSPDSYVVPSDAVAQNVTFHLAYQDRVHLQQRPPLFTSQNTSFVTFAELDAVRDVYGNELVSHDVYGAQNVGYHLFPANYFNPDVVPPTLLALYAEESSYTNVTFYFSEAILPSSVQTGGIHAFKRTSGATFSLEYAKIVYPTPDRWHVHTNFITLDLTHVKTTLTGASIFTRQSNTFAYLRREGAVKDATKGEFLNNTASFSGSTSSLMEGLTFLSFRLDLSQRTLILEMPFPANITSLKARSFTLRTSMASYRFDSFTSFSMPNAAQTADEFFAGTRDHMLRIVYSAADAQEVLSIMDLAAIKLAISEDAVTDALGRTMSRTPSMTLPCVHITYDAQAPTVTSFTLDVQQGLMAVYLSKPVEVSTIALLPSQLVLTPSQYNDQASETSLRPGEVAISDAYLSYSSLAYATNRTNSITLDLNVYPSSASLNEGFAFMTMRELVLAQFAFASTGNNVYLRIPYAGTAYDLSSSSPPLALAAIASATALQASSLTRDTEAPYLVAYTLNMNARKLVLNFSEAVNVSSIAPTNYVVVHIGTDDADNMMRRARRLVLSAAQTYLSFLAGSFEDLATPANANEVVLYRYGVQVTHFVADQRPPSLVWFNLSMQDGGMTMRFDEVVDCRSFAFDRVFFQAQQFLGALADEQSRLLDDNNRKMFLTNTTRCLGPRRYDTTHRVQLSAKDLIRLKATQAIARDAATTFMGLEPDAFRDVFGNGNEAVPDLQVLPVRGFTADTQAPRIVGVSVSGTKLLTVFFDEPVDVASIDFVRQWAFQTDAVYNGSTGAGRSALVYLSHKSSLFRFNALRTVVEVDVLMDAEYMMASSALLRDDFGRAAQDHTFFTATAASVRDMAGNALAAIDYASALQLGPTVWYWDLDMDAGTLALTFTARFVQPQIALTGLNVTSVDNPQLSYTFVGTGYVLQRLTNHTLHYQSYAVQLQAQDVNGLKLSGLLTAIADGDAAALLPSPDVMHYTPRLLLRAAFGVTSSVDADDLVPGLATIAIPDDLPRPIRYFVPDESPPLCLGFTLNFNLNQLRLHFSEAVDVASLVLPDVVLFSSTEGNLVEFPYATLPFSSSPLRAYAADNITLALANDTDVVLHFTSATQLFHPAWDALKRQYLLSGQTLDSLVLRQGAIADLSGNVFVGNTETSPFPLVAVVEDTTPPSIESFAVDLDAYALWVTFDDIVEASDFQPGHAAAANAVSRVYLLPNSSAALQYLVSTFNASSTALFADADHLERVGQILLLSNFTVVEYAETADGVDYRTLRFDLAYLREDQFRFEALYAARLYQQHQAVTFYRDAASSVIAFQRARDWVGNVDTGLLVSAASTFTARTAAPVLEAYDVELLAASVRLTLYFSSMMRIGNFSCADWQLQTASDEAASTVVTWTSAECSVVTTTDARVVQFTVDDLSLVSGTTIGQADLLETTWLTTRTSPSGGAYLSRDIYGNLVTSRVYATALAADALPTALTDYNVAYYFGALQPGPRILQASLDMDTGAVLVVFSTSVDVAAFTNISTWAFQFNDAFAGDVKLTTFLSDTDFDYATQQPVPDTTFSTLTTYGPDSASSLAIALTLSTNNLNRVKRLATRFNPAPDVRRDVYLYATAQTLVVDASLGEALVPASVRLSRFFADTVHPTVRNATLHLGHEQLTIDFDEPIDVDSFVVTRFFLQPTRVAAHDYNNANGGGSDAALGYLRLQDSGVLSWSDTRQSVVVNLTRDDANFLKNHPRDLARNASSVFLGVIVGAATDQAGNVLQPIAPTDAMRVEGFVADHVAPFIAAFDLDMDAAPVRLTLQFSEPMALDSFNLSRLILQSRFLSSAGVAYRLTGGSVAVQTMATTSTSTSTSSAAAALYAETVVVTLTTADVNNMKRTGQLIRNKNAAFLRQEALATDVAGNVVDAIYDNEALACRTFTVDATPPTLVSSRLDMHVGELALVFDEPTILGSVQVAGLTLVSTRPRRHVDDIRDADYFFYRLTPTTTAQVTVGGVATAYVSNGSYVTNPDRNAVLSETMTLVLSATDQNNLKRRYPLASSTETTFLSVDATFITDYVGNGIAATQYRSAYALSSYEIDRVRPSVAAYVLNMDTAPVVVHLAFSECVDVRALQLHVAFLQNFNTRRFGQFLNLNASKVLVGALPVEPQYLAADAAAMARLRAFAAAPVAIAEQLSPANQAADARECQELTLLIDDADAVRTLRDANIGVDATRSFLTFTEAFARDHAANQVTPHYDGSVVDNLKNGPTTSKLRPYPPLAPSTLVVDATPPTLTRWFYDNATFTLTLDFSEPVDVTNATALYVTHPAFLRQSAELAADVAAANAPTIGLPLFLRRQIERKRADEGASLDDVAVDWTYQRRATRVRYTFDPAADDYCLSFAYVRQLLAEAAHTVVGPHRNLVLVNASRLYDEQFRHGGDAYTNRSCARSIFTGAFLGVDFFAFLNATAPSGALGLVVASGYAVRDKAYAPNYLAGTIGRSQGRNPALDAVNSNYRLPATATAAERLGYVVEGAPVCGACPLPTQFIAANCSSLEDRVCQTCRSCAAGAAYDVSIASDGPSGSPYTSNAMYAMFPCRGFMDAVCAPCKTCPFGTFVRQPCANDSNTQCAPCSACADDEYIVKPCALGYDTQCASCLTCDLLNTAAYVAPHRRIPSASDPQRIVDFCHRTAKNAHRNRLWFEKSCCLNSDGRHVPCSALATASMTLAKTRDATSTTERLRRAAAAQWTNLQRDSLRVDYEELSPISAN
eukprot:gene4827-3461_t